jgi:nucleoid-associated protein YgaU
MYKTKKESRPAATESAIMMREVFGTPSKKKYITLFGKKQVVISIILVLILILLTIKVIGDVFTPSRTFIPVEHKVTYGDTLWGIAKEYKPDGMTMDRYMAWVYDHNDGGMIYPGDTVIMAEVVE